MLGSVGTEINRTSGLNIIIERSINNLALRSRNSHGQAPGKSYRAGDVFLRIFLSYICVITSASVMPAQESHKTWSDYGSGADNSKYVALAQITKANVNQLTVAWRYPTRDSSSYLFNPIVVDNVMYVLARGNALVALNAETGKEIWVHENLGGIQTRGINYWESKDRRDRRLIFQINHFIEEIDASTGKSILTFGHNGLVDFREGLGRDPDTIAQIKNDTPGRVFENLIILGSSTGENYMASPGHIRAYNVITGKMAWIFHTIPQPGEFGYETWPKDAWKYAGGTNTWGEISLDEKRGIAYFPTGSSTYDMYGADRIGKDLFADCLLALDARTGKLLWYFQMVHHDLWDYDATSAPQLITIRHNGRTIDAVAAASKQGFLYVFNRVTGEPIWPIEERPVPKSDVPGEQAWPTQPFPTKPPPFARQKMTADDVNPYFLTPEERASWKERIANANNSGLFTPPSFFKETVALPGARGGSNWGTTSSNPEKGLVYVLSQDWPSIIPKVGKLAPTIAGGQGGTGQEIFQRNCKSCHGADREGSAIAPSLVGVASRLKLEDFELLMASGRGQMPAFSWLTSASVNSLFAYLANPTGGSSPPTKEVPQKPLGGPVVASGGAPGGLVVSYGVAQKIAKYGGNFSGPPYPSGVQAPERLYADYGLTLPYIIGPPWSSMVAYDLNEGVIKWKVPLGEDAEAAAQGGKATGVVRGGERRGIVVTSTGLLFVNADDGKVRAYDAENGKVLWTATLPVGTQGIPAMYEVNGREYLVVTAAAPSTSGRGQEVHFAFEDLIGRVEQPTEGSSARAYVAFALPR
jgi:quinoprotein glucose dehydrogenase